MYYEMTKFEARCYDESDRGDLWLANWREARWSIVQKVRGDLGLHDFCEVLHPDGFVAFVIDGGDV